MTVRMMGEILTATAARAPGDIAFLDGTSQLTFAEAEKQSNQLAHLLRAEGVETGDRVAVFLPRVLDCAIALYATFKAGAVVVPIDPEAPAARVRAILDRCDVKVMIARSADKPAIDAVLQGETPVRTVIGATDLAAELHCVGIDRAANHPETPPELDIAPGDPAYIIHTSGSTGEPKGICHTHASGLAYTELVTDTLALTAADRIACPLMLQFDYALVAYFGGPFSGASTLIIPAAHTRMPVSLSALLAATQSTIFFSVSTGLSQLISYGFQPDHDLSALRVVMFGGEPFQTEALVAGMARLPGADFLNFYGPAETNACVMHWIRAGDCSASVLDTIPIGKVWDKTHAVILDEDRRDVALGEPGELAVSSVTNMSGYWQRDDLNARVFLERDGRSYYLTGDVVRQDESGCIWLLGRVDRQIKLNGYRIELDEIEHGLASHPDVVVAGAVAVKEGGTVTSIAAWVQLRPGADVETRALMRHAHQVLPRHTVPARISIADALPLTTTGKIDRKSLEQRAKTLEGAT